VFLTDIATSGREKRKENGTTKWFDNVWPKA
jgi:hypothetical protein